MPAGDAAGGAGGLLGAEWWLRCGLLRRWGDPCRQLGEHVLTGPNRCRGRLAGFDGVGVGVDDQQPGQGPWFYLVNQTGLSEVQLLD